MAQGNLAGRGPVNITAFTAPIKATPVNADQVILIDSEDSNQLKLADVDTLPGGSTSIQGTVATYNDLLSGSPLADSVGAFWAVTTATGLLWNRRPGIYRKIDNSTWTRLSNATFEVLDSESTMSDNSDNTKKMAWQLDQITTGTTRTITMADRDLNLSTPTFDTIDSLGDITITKVSGAVDITAETQSDDDVTFTMTNAIGTWTHEVNAGNADYLLRNNGVNTIVIGGNITSGEGLKFEQGTTTFNREGVDRNLKVFGLDGGGGAPELICVDAGLGRVQIGGGVSPSAPTEVLDVTGNILASGRLISDDTTQATSGTDGSIQTDGGISCVKDLYVTGNSKTVRTGQATQNIIESDTTMATMTFIRTAVRAWQVGIDINDSNKFKIGRAQAVDFPQLAFEINESLNATFKGTLSVDDTTDSSSTTTGSLQTDGGLGVVKKGYFGDDVTLTKAGTVTLNLIDTTRGTALFNAGAEFDFRWSKTTGTAVIDFEGRPVDGTSEAQYRFGLSSGSTGANKIILFDANGSNLQAQIASSATTTYFNRQGGNFAIGSDSTINSAKLGVHGRIETNSTTESSSTTTGSIVTAGGIGVAKNVRLGGSLILTDGITAPSTTAGQAKIYVDTADGDLKIKFGDGTTKTIVTDT